MLRLLLVCTAALLLQACDGTMRTYPDVPSRQPLPANQAGSRPLYLSKVRFDIEVGTMVGQELSGKQCGNAIVSKWSGTRNAYWGRMLAQDFDNEFRAAGYSVIGHGDDLFQDSKTGSAELLVGAIVDWIATDYCYPWAGLGVWSDIEGAAYVHVKWQIYDGLAQKTVYQSVSEGRFDVHHTDPNGWPTFIDHAMDQAVRNLLADPALSQALGAAPQLDASPAQPAAAGLAPPPSPGGDNAAEDSDATPLLVSAARPAAGIDAPRAATVMIGTAGFLGSGILISSDGYILTNYHVVQESPRVRVTLSDNRHLIGQVLRRDSRRDVALVRIAGSGYPAAALRLPPDVQVGDEVFAIGSPLAEQNALTVTRGIISAFRSLRGYPLIQSDASIQHGNSGGPLVDRNGKVVALCVSGQMTNDVSEGLNYFIPIDDAINRLHIQLQ